MFGEDPLSYSIPELKLAAALEALSTKGSIGKVLDELLVRIQSLVSLPWVDAVMDAFLPHLTSLILIHKQQEKGLACFNALFKLVGGKGMVSYKNRFIPQVLLALATSGGATQMITKSLLFPAVEKEVIVLSRCLKDILQELQLCLEGNNLRKQASRHGLNPDIAHQDAINAVFAVTRYLLNHALRSEKFSTELSNEIEIIVDSYDNNNMNIIEGRISQLKIFATTDFSSECNIKLINSFFPNNSINQLYLKVFKYTEYSVTDNYIKEIYEVLEKFNSDKAYTRSIIEPFVQRISKKDIEIEINPKASILLIQFLSYLKSNEYLKNNIIEEKTEIIFIMDFAVQVTILVNEKLDKDIVNTICNLDLSITSIVILGIKSILLQNSKNAIDSCIIKHALKSSPNLEYAKAQCVAIEGFFTNIDFEHKYDILSYLDYELGSCIRAQYINDMVENISLEKKSDIKILCGYNVRKLSSADGLYMQKLHILLGQILQSCKHSNDTCSDFVKLIELFKFTTVSLMELRKGINQDSAIIFFGNPVVVDKPNDTEIQLFKDTPDVLLGESSKAIEEFSRSVGTKIFLNSIIPELNKLEDPYLDHWDSMYKSASNVTNALYYYRSSCCSVNKEYCLLAVILSRDPGQKTYIEDLWVRINRVRYLNMLWNKKSDKLPDYQEFLGHLVKNADELFIKSHSKELISLNNDDAICDWKTLSQFQQSTTWPKKIFPIALTPDDNVDSELHEAFLAAAIAHNIHSILDIMLDVKTFKLEYNRSAVKTPYFEEDEIMITEDGITAEGWEYSVGVCCAVITEILSVGIQVDFLKVLKVSRISPYFSALMKIFTPEIIEKHETDVISTLSDHLEGVFLLRYQGSRLASIRNKRCCVPLDYTSFNNNMEKYEQLVSSAILKLCKESRQPPTNRTFLDHFSREGCEKFYKQLCSALAQNMSKYYVGCCIPKQQHKNSTTARWLQLKDHIGREYLGWPAIFDFGSDVKVIEPHHILWCAAIDNIQAHWEIIMGRDKPIDSHEFAEWSYKLEIALDFLSNLNLEQVHQAPISSAYVYRIDRPEDYPEICGINTTLPNRGLQGKTILTRTLELWDISKPKFRAGTRLIAGHVNFTVGINFSCSEKEEIQRDYNKTVPLIKSIQRLPPNANYEETLDALHAAIFLVRLEAHVDAVGAVKKLLAPVIDNIAWQSPSELAAVGYVAKVWREGVLIANETPYVAYQKAKQSFISNGATTTTFAPLRIGVTQLPCEFALVDALCLLAACYGEQRIMNDEDLSLFGSCCRELATIIIKRKPEYLFYLNSSLIAMEAGISSQIPTRKNCPISPLVLQAVTYYHVESALCMENKLHVAWNQPTSCVAYYYLDKFGDLRYKEGTLKKPNKETETPVLPFSMWSSSWTKVFIFERLYSILKSLKDSKINPIKLIPSLHQSIKFEDSPTVSVLCDSNASTPTLNLSLNHFEVTDKILEAADSLTQDSMELRYPDESSLKTYPTLWDGTAIVPPLSLEFLLETYTGKFLPLLVLILPGFPLHSIIASADNWLQYVKCADDIALRVPKLISWALVLVQALQNFPISVITRNSYEFISLCKVLQAITEITFRSTLPSDSGKFGISAWDKFKSYLSNSVSELRGNSLDDLLMPFGFGLNNLNPLLTALVPAVYPRLTTFGCWGWYTSVGDVPAHFINARAVLVGLMKLDMYDTTNSLIPNHPALLDTILVYFVSEINKLGGEPSVKAELRNQEIRISLRADTVDLTAYLVPKPNFPLESLETIRISCDGLSKNQLISLTAEINNILSTYRLNGVVQAAKLMRSTIAKSLPACGGCLICLEHLNENKKLPDKTCKTCSKQFHSSCLKHWFNERKKISCPLCARAWR